ncbi:MAG: glycosyl hydrolase 108 family protein [Pseudomonadota bacterium]
MSSSNDRLSTALAFTLRWEGGYVNHPADPGGATNKGVTKRVYDAYRAAKGQSVQDVRNITDAEVHDIYENGYWRKAKCPDLAVDLDTVQFDTAVNMGVGRAIKFMQKSTGCAADGVWGPITAAKVAACDPGTTLKAYCDTREAFYVGLVARRPQMKVFMKGWMNRLNDLRGFVGLPGFESVGGEIDLGEGGFMMRLDDDPYEGEDTFI